MYSKDRISPNDKKGDNSKSRICIELFKVLAINNNLNPEIVPEDTKDNKQKGIDAYLDIDGKRVAVDVKSESPFQDAICLEHRKISGDIGSLFKDYTEYFVFERKDGFNFYRTKDLRERFTKLVDINSESICTVNKHLCWDTINKRYKLYTMLDKSYWRRWWDNKPNQDRFAYILISDIEDLLVMRLMK
jgi:hypothetical protein